MEKYIGVKVVFAMPMSLVDAEELLGRKIKPGNEAGYLVEYQDKYKSWSPKDAFEKSYRRTEGMTFGQAIEAMKTGNRVARAGWNGKGMFVVFQKGYPEGIPCNLQTAKAWGLNEGDLFKCEPYLQIKMANGSHTMWVPSINDVLAEDWYIADK